MSELQPRAGWCILERAEVPEQTATGLYIPDVAREVTPGPWATYDATVLAVGPPIERDDGRWVEADFAAGDRVIANWSHVDLDAKNRPHKYGRKHIVKIEDVLATVDQDAEVDRLPSKQALTGETAGRLAKPRGGK